MHHHRHVAQHGLGAGGGHHDGIQSLCFQRAVCVHQRVADVPERAFFLFAFHLQIAHGAHQHRVPVHQTLAAVNQALFIQLHKGFCHRFGQLFVHGEVLAAPVHAVAHSAHLGGDSVSRFFFPLPHLLGEGLAPQVVAADVLLLQLALHHDLGGNAGVVGARNPSGVKAGHAVVAGQAVHDGLVERVPHMQRAGHVGRRQLDGEVLTLGGGCRIGRAGAAEAGHPVAPLFPLGAPMRLERCGFKRFGKAVEAGL